MSNGHVTAGQYLRRIGLAMILPSMLTAVLLAANASTTVRKLDAAAVDREAQRVRHGLALLGALHATEQTGYSNWDSSVANIVTSFDLAWVQSYFSKEKLSTPDRHQMVIVDRSGNPIFWSERGKAPPEEVADAIRKAAGPAIAAVRQIYGQVVAAGASLEDRRPGALIDGIYVNDVGVFDGRPMMITVTPIIDSTSDNPPEETAVLVGLRTMTSEVLAELGTLAGVQDLAIAPEAPSATPVAPSTHSLGLESLSGQHVASLTWSIALPHSAVLEAQLPALTAALAAIAIATVLGASTVFRLSARLSASEQAARESARTDPLTGLANRGWFLSVLATLVGGKNAERRAVLLIDCDHFKAINDSLGHAAGDAVLVSIAERMKGLGELVAIASRLGGDEFALVSKPLPEHLSTLAFAEKVADTLARPVRGNGLEIPLGVSVGAAEVAGGTAASVEEILARADLALYRAKRDGRGCTRTYNPEIDTLAAYLVRSVQPRHNGVPAAKAA